MKYFLLFLIILSFIGTSVSDDKTTGNVLKDSVYNYITSLDNTFNYLVENVSFFSNISENSYKTSYNSIMKDRIFQEHLVQPGETLDSIIQIYNNNKEVVEFQKLMR